MTDESKTRIKELIEVVEKRKKRGDQIRKEAWRLAEEMEKLEEEDSVNSELLGQALDEIDNIRLNEGYWAITIKTENDEYIFEDDEGRDGFPKKIVFNMGG